MSVHERGRKPTLKPSQDALTKAPPVPKNLNRYAKAEWRRIMPALIERGTLTRADLAGVENYCAAIGYVRQIDEAQATNDLPDPKLAGVAIRYSTLARQLAAEYGLSPTSRARLGTAQESDDGDVNPLDIK